MKTPFRDFGRLIELGDALSPSPPVRRYFIYFGAAAAPPRLVALNDGERAYYATAGEARATIRFNGWEDFASVEVSE